MGCLGKRKQEVFGRFPNHGWARIDSLRADKWKPWFTGPVLISANNLIEKDHDKQSRWVTLAPGMAIQALLTERNEERRVYVVTEETRPEYQWVHDRWPRLRKVAEKSGIITNGINLCHDCM